MKTLLLLVLAVIAGSLFAFTPVSPLPDIDYFSTQPRIAGWGDDVLVLPEFEDQDIYQLRYDGWEWEVVNQLSVLEVTGKNRMNPRDVYPSGGQILILESDPEVTELFVPRLNVLSMSRVAPHEFFVAQRVSLAPLLDDPDIWSVMVHDTVVLDDIMVVTLQVDKYGSGADILVYTFVRTDGEWALGPTFDPVTGYHWALDSRWVDGSLHLLTMGLVAYSPPPYSYSLIEYKLQDNEWVALGEVNFQHDFLWAGMDSVRTVVSADGSSMILYRSEFKSGPCLELNKVDGAWTYGGAVNGGALDMSDLYFEAVGDGYALMRRGDAVYVPNQGIPQHYHILKHVDGEWILEGDITSHRYLSDYYYTEIFHVLGPDSVTIFDIKPYYPTTREARRYNLEGLTPRLVKWFRNSQTIDGTTEYLPAFGYFKPLVTESGSTLWVWHWNLGWLYLYGRGEQQFWFWNHAYDWAWFNHGYFNIDAGNHWLYAWNHSDYIWCEPQSVDPRYFYSYKLGEWMSDTVAEPMTEADVDELIALLAMEAELEGVTIEVDFPNRVAVMTAEDTVDGSIVVVRIDIPFDYTTGTDYACQAHFYMDMAWIQVTIDNQEPVYLHSTDFWEQAGLLLPMYLTMDLIFHTQESGISIQTIQYNNGTQEGPVREVF